MLTLLTISAILLDSMFLIFQNSCSTIILLLNFSKEVTIALFIKSSLKSLELLNLIQSNPISDYPQMNQSIRFFPGHPVYEGNMKEYRSKIDKARSKCVAEMNKFINEGGCNDDDYCLQKAQIEAEHCKATVEGGLRDTLQREWNQLKHRVETLEEEKRTQNIAQKDYKILESELNGLKQELNNTEHEMLQCTNIGNFKNFPGIWAIIVLVLSTVLLVVNFISQRSPIIDPDIQKNFFPLILVLSLSGITISSIQLESIFSKK